MPVYMIQPVPGGLVKIGSTSRSVTDRLKHLQVGSPVPLRVIYIATGGWDLESRLHERFDAMRAHGEWFEFHDDMVKFGKFKPYLVNADVSRAAPVKRKKRNRKKHRLQGDKMDRALEMMADPSYSWQDITDLLGIGSMMTVKRRIKEATGTYDRTVAMRERAAGNWPPKRKLTR